MEDKGGEPDKVFIRGSAYFNNSVVICDNSYYYTIELLITLFGFTKTFKRRVLNVFLFGIKQLRSIEMQQFFDDYFISWYGSCRANFIKVWRNEITKFSGCRYYEFH